MPAAAARAVSVSTLALALLTSRLQAIQIQAQGRPLILARDRLPLLTLAPPLDQIFRMTRRLTQVI